MKTRIKKVFMDFNLEEEWLNQQGENGLMLVGYRNGEYEFEDVSPVEFQYKLDITDYSGSKKKDYFDFLEGSGISVVCEYGGRVYLRKRKSEGPLELYSTNAELRKQARKRCAHFFATGITQFFLGIIFLIQMFLYMKENNTAFWVNAVFGTACAVAGIVFFVIGIVKRKRYSSYKEEAGIWE
ncbi:MAG: DUF2812 domain-containing protein [Lachnospiraceae bacterium]|jgi:hypothetical protein